MGSFHLSNRLMKITQQMNERDCPMTTQNYGQDTGSQEESPLDQTLIEILSSLSEKSSPKISDPLDLKPQRPSTHKLQEPAASDDEQVTTFYDKSQSMNAPKPTQVP